MTDEGKKPTGTFADDSPPEPSVIFLDPEKFPIKAPPKPQPKPRQAPTPQVDDTPVDRWTPGGTPRRGVRGVVAATIEFFRRAIPALAFAAVIGVAWLVARNFV